MILFFLFLVFFAPVAHAELENFQAADVVLGQPDFTQNTANNGAASPSAKSLSGPLGTFSDGKRLFVADQTNRRFLIWNSIPTSNFVAADIVLGQPDFTSSTANNGGVSARSINTPRPVYSDNKKLFASDQANNRVLIWNTIPTTNFAPADVVLGQPDFASNTANNGGISARSSSSPFDVFSDGKRLFVPESGNHRVLIWNKIPNANFTPADVVLGQPDFTQGTANNGGVSARSINFPVAVFSDGKRLFVTDFSNNRILIWNKIPTTSSTPADVVLGQPDFSQNSANNGGISARSLSGPTGVFSDGRRLFATDRANNRVLVWNKIPAENFAPADIVLGQPDFVSSTANNGGVSARSSNQPRQVFSDGKRLFISEQNNNRILIFNLSGSSHKPDPQFEQGKAVVGKVFEDRNGNGIQDQDVGATRRVARTNEIEQGIEGVKVVSDTGIYAITDQDGKYHFPYIETGQHVLKIDQDTLPEGSTLTTDNPYKATITKGILTKVSFGVKLKELNKPNELNQLNDLLKLSITQDTQKPTKTLGITAELKEDKILFTTTCNYFLFVKESEIMLYDSEGKKPVIPLPLPHPVPLYFELPLSVIPKTYHSLYYQLIVRDAQGREDRTSVGRIKLK